MHCDKKLHFIKKKVARLIADQKELEFGCKFYIYHCPECFRYHLTRMSPKAVKVAKKRIRIYKSKNSKKS